LDIIPLSVDLIVGVPRSGLLVANLIALKLNLPLTDVSGLCEGRLLQAGQRGKKFRFKDVKHALVVDDSVCSGFSINVARKQIEDANVLIRIDYAAVYVAPDAQCHVDLFWEICPLPRVFEWNVMHHSIVEKACVDIDGVLCRDPMESENDDGERYLNFMKTVQPLVVPTGIIYMLVTCRLEKYRTVTEEWLAVSKIRYMKLVMLDMPDGEARRRWGKHGEFKGEVYRNSDACLFIESSESQAYRIANTSIKPVLAVDVNQMIYPGAVPVAKEVARRLPSYGVQHLIKLKQRILRCLSPDLYMY
jgi:orotate phosphoribosyltransferase